MTPAPSNRITYLGRTTRCNSDVLFGIRQTDTRLHVACTGKSGTGKSHFLKTLMAQDLRADAGFALFDPHGDLALAVRELAAVDGAENYIYLDPANRASRWRLNPFADVAPQNHSLAAAGIVEVFKKLWNDDWDPDSSTCYGTWPPRSSMTCPPTLIQRLCQSGGWGE